MKYFCMVLIYSFSEIQIRSVTKLDPTLCDPVDCSPPGSSVCGILQARILEWVAIPFSKGSSQPRVGTHVSCIAGRFFTAGYWVVYEER